MIIFIEWYKRIFSLGLLTIVLCKDNIENNDEFIVLKTFKFCILRVYHHSYNAFELQKRKRMRTNPSFILSFLNPKILEKY